MLSGEMSDAEVIARDRTRHDSQMVLAAKRFAVAHFGGDTQRAAWFFDELSKGDG